MTPASPQLQLDTLFVRDGRGRVVGTREPQPSPGPAFVLVRGPAEVAWAVRCDVPDALAGRLSDLARGEPATDDWHRPPVHAARYLAALGGPARSGPGFDFPAALPAADGVTELFDEGPLGRHFTGWVPGEVAAGAGPLLAVVEDGWPVSVCFCARRSDRAAEAGLETAAGFRGRGYAPRVTAAWAAAVRRTGRTPLYSTDWTNPASLAVAGKLGLRVFSTAWSVGG